MKKSLILITLLSVLSSFSNEDNLAKKEIEDEAYKFYNGKEAEKFIKNQERAYDEMKKNIEASDLSKEEKTLILFRLKSMYGNNYEKQNSKVKQEINDYLYLKELAESKAELKKSEEKNKKIEERNIESKKELETVEKNSKIPEIVMNRFKSEAERLYPGNYYEQKRYIESSMGNYEFFLNLKQK